MDSILVCERSEPVCSCHLIFAIHIMCICTRDKSVKHVAHSVRNITRMRKTRNSVRRLSCSATALTGKLTVSAKERSSHARGAV